MVMDSSSSIQRFGVNSNFQVTFWGRGPYPGSELKNCKLGRGQGRLLVRKEATVSLPPPPLILITALH